MVIACFPQVFTTSGVCLSELISLQRVEVIQCLDVMSKHQGNKHILLTTVSGLLARAVGLVLLPCTLLMTC